VCHLPPALASGSAVIDVPVPLSCLNNVAVFGPRTETITWNDGQSGTLVFTREVSAVVGVQFTLTSTGGRHLRRVRRKDRRGATRRPHAHPARLPLPAGRDQPHAGGGARDHLSREGRLARRGTGGGGWGGPSAAPANALR